MALTRSFRMAPALARLLARETGHVDHREGYYDGDAQRNAHVTIGDGKAHLGMAGQDLHEIPMVHAQALVEVADRTINRERSTFEDGGTTIHLDRYPSAGIDLATFELGSDAAAAAFSPPEWVGEEVTGNDAFAGRALSGGAPESAGEVPMANDSLESLLDLLERRTGTGGDRDEVVVTRSEPTSLRLTAG